MADELHWADWLVFALFIILTTSVGIIIGVVNRKKATSKDFLQAGSEMHFFPVAMSLQASFLSAIFVVSMPAESYNFGIAYVYLAFSYFIAFPLIGKLFLPIYFQLKLSGAYEVTPIILSSNIHVHANFIVCSANNIALLLRHLKLYYMVCTAKKCYFSDILFNDFDLSNGKFWALLISHESISKNLTIQARNVINPTFNLKYVL